MGTQSGSPRGLCHSRLYLRGTEVGVRVSSTGGGGGSVCVCVRVCCVGGREKESVELGGLWSASPRLPPRVCKT